MAMEIDTIALLSRERPIRRWIELDNDKATTRN